MEKALGALLRARDGDGVVETVARWILAERLEVGEEALNKLIGAVGMARRQAPKPPRLGGKVH